jgi:hypothetical protein
VTDAAIIFYSRLALKCAGYQRKARVGGFSYAGEKAENLNDFES